MSLILCRQGDNKTLKDFKDIVEYCTDPIKTKDSCFTFAFGCITDDPLSEMIAVKTINGKSYGRQYTQTIISPTPVHSSVSNEEYMDMAKEIGKHYYDLGFQCVVTVHFDTGKRHVHLLVNTVSLVNANKFSQSISQLNRFKLHCNRILSKYGFDLVKSPTEKILDEKPYSFKDGYEFLEAYDEIAEDIAFNFYDVTEYANSGYSLDSPKATIYNPDAPVNSFNRLLYMTNPIYRDYVDACRNCPPPVIDLKNAWGPPSEMRPMAPPTSVDDVPAIIIKDQSYNNGAYVDLYSDFSGIGLGINYSRNYDVYVPKTVEPSDIDGVVRKIPFLSEKEKNDAIRSAAAAQNALHRKDNNSKVALDLSENIKIHIGEEYERKIPQIIDVETDDENNDE